MYIGTGEQPRSRTSRAESRALRHYSKPVRVVVAWPQGVVERLVRLARRRVEAVPAAAHARGGASGGGCAAHGMHGDLGTACGALGRVLHTLERFFGDVTFLPPRALGPRRPRFRRVGEVLPLALDGPEALAQPRVEHRLDLHVVQHACGTHTHNAAA